MANVPTIIPIIKNIQKVKLSLFKNERVIKQGHKKSNGKVNAIYFNPFTNSF